MRKAVAGVVIGLLVGAGSPDAGESRSELGWAVERKGRDVSIKIPKGGRHRGKRATIEYVNRPQLLSVRTAADRAGPAYTVVVDGVQFTLMIPDEVEPRIEYIATDALGFVSPEGLKVGSDYGDMTQHALGEIVQEPEWGFFVCLPSGWAAVFACNEGRWGLVGPEKVVHKRTGGVRYCEDMDLEFGSLGWFFRRRGTCGN